MQTITSANTSVNSSKLPAISKKIDWEQFRNGTIIDYGGGKYDNFKHFLKENYNIELLVYDPYNRSDEENKEVLGYLTPNTSPICFCPSAIICNNVFNVIKEDEIVADLIKKFLKLVPFCSVFITVYEGNNLGIGGISKKDCYQRNCSTKFYKEWINSLSQHEFCTRNKVICHYGDLKFVK